MSISEDKDVNNMTLGESLKKIRKQYKMTQEDVAKFLGVSRSGYTYYETGKTVPSIDMFRKLAMMYDTTIDSIVGVPAKKNATGKNITDISLISENNADPLMYMKKEEQTLIMAFRLLSEEDKTKITEKVVSMIDGKNEG